MYILEDKYIQHVSPEVFEEYLSSVTNCRSLLEQLEHSLTFYSDAKIKNTKEIYKDKIKQYLSEIKSSDGFGVFLILFNYQFINSQNEVVIPEVIELIPVVNPTNIAKCPWDAVIMQIYQNDIEKRFAKDPLTTPNPQRISDIDDYKNVLMLDPEIAAIIRTFTNQQKNPRTREIYDLFGYYCILKELNKDFDYRIIKKGGQGFPANEEEIKSIQNEIIMYFKEYYEKIESQIDGALYEPPLVVNDWNRMIGEVTLFHNELINFKNNHLKDLINYDKDEIDRLLLEIRNFLIKSENLDWKIYPKVSDINGIDGGSGLIKKIISKGGMKKIGGMYNLKVKDWLVENALKEELQFQQPKSESGIEDLDFPF